MVDTLSQNEIDALLSALQPTEDAAVAAPEPAPAAAVSVSTDSSKEQKSDFSKDVAAISNFEASSSSQSSSSSSTTKQKGKERKYDFKRQTKFSKEQLGTLELIHESFARLIGTDISTRLRMGTKHGPSFSLIMLMASSLD